jgi:hypothetical protein
MYIMHCFHLHVVQMSYLMKFQYISSMGYGQTMRYNFHCQISLLLQKTTHLALIIGLCILLRVYQLIYVETSVHNKCRCSFYCALLTVHVSAPIGGHFNETSTDIRCVRRFLHILVNTFGIPVDPRYSVILFSKSCVY